MRGLVRYVTCEDKQSRVQVPQLVPDGGFLVDKHPCIGPFFELREGKYLWPRFVHRGRSEGGAHDDPSSADEWSTGALKTAGDVPRSTATKCVQSIYSHALGMPIKELQRRKRSGGHPGRHVLPSIGGYLSWPEPEIDATTDHAPAKTSDAGPGRPRRSSTESRRATAKKSFTYKPRADAAKAAYSRARAMDAARAFIKLAGGYDALTWDTTWGDIIPLECPSPELARFYGAGWAAAGASTE